MPDSTPQDVTELLRAWSEGERSALDKLVPLVYVELRRLARYHLKHENPGHMLQTTALVNEAYLRLTDSKRLHWRNRAHFFAICAQLMRQILVDFARTWSSQKRGGGVPHVFFDEAILPPDERDVDLVALDDALQALSRVDERKGRVVELRFFGGLEVEETAAVLKVSPETVARDWRLARAWLFRELRRRPV